MNIGYHGYEFKCSSTKIVEVDLIGSEGKLYGTDFESIIERITTYEHRHRKQHLLFHRESFSPINFEEMQRDHPDYDRILQQVDRMTEPKIPIVPFNNEMYLLYSITDKMPKHKITANLKKEGVSMDTEGVVDLGTSRTLKRLELTNHYQDLQSLLDIHYNKLHNQNVESNLNALHHQGIMILRNLIPKNIQFY